jgi:hypothetical protein
MNNRSRLTIGLIISTLLFLSCQSMVYAESIQQLTIPTKLQNIISELNLDLTQDTFETQNLELPTWFPGFLIVQLIKGIIAFFVVLMVLFGIIEP